MWGFLITFLKCGFIIHRSSSNYLPLKYKRKGIYYVKILRSTHMMHGHTKNKGIMCSRVDEVHCNIFDVF